MVDTINNYVENIFETISKRILDRKNKLGKTRTDITNDDNVQLLSNIMHNKRLTKRNPYLLNDSITYDIVKNLNFNSSYELIWGKGNKLDQILKDLFYIGINLLEHSDPDLIEYCYYEYLPYTKEAAIFDSSTGSLQTDIETVGTQQQFAKEYLYFELSDKWEERHYSFFKDKGTKKLDKLLNDFLSSTLRSSLQEFLNETNHNGQNTYDLMSSIIGYENEDEFESIAHGPEWFAHQPLTNSEKPIAEVRQSIIEAGEKYINTIVNAQKETDPFFEFES